MMRGYFPLQPPLLQNELQDSSYRYQEFSPSKGLTPYVACYWTVEFKLLDHGKLHRIIPDGCVDIIFDLRSTSFSQGAFVTGLMTSYETMSFTRNYSLFGIRFFADQVRRFIKYPVSEMNGNRVPLEDLWGSEAKWIVEEVQSVHDVLDMVEVVEHRLLQQLHRCENYCDQRLLASMQYMVASQGMLSVRDLADQLNYSERNVRRIFQKELGVSPKELLSIIQFQSLLQGIYKRDTTTRFTDMAVQYGYYDQSHFIHHFKRYYGLVPNQVFQ